MQQVLIGVDLGTTSTKAVAFNLAGQVLFSTYQEYPILTPQPTYSEQNPHDVFAAVITTLAEVIKFVGPQSITGIGFSSAMHSVIALNQAGNLLTNCLIWADNRSEQEAEALKQTELGYQIYLHTGTPLHPMSPLCKLLWLKKNNPAVFQETSKFISIKEYIFYKFYGRFLIDYSLASATGLFDIRTLTWYQPALNLIGISGHQLSEPVSPLHIEQELKPEILKKLGLVTSIPVIIGASDGCLANLGTGATAPGRAALTIGTSGAIRVTTPQPAHDEQRRLFNYILSSTQYVVGGPVNNGGIILRWFRDTFAPDLKLEARQQGIDAYDLILKEAAAVPAGAAGLLFLPYLLGERAPHWDAEARGVFFGINISHTRAHFARAVVEGIVFNMYQVAQALEETTGPITSIFANGGFARSTFWVQLVADIFNKKVYLTDTVETAAWGAALLVAEALYIPANPFLLPNTEYLPDPEQHAAYLRHFTIFEKLYPLLKTSLQEITTLQKK